MLEFSESRTVRWVAFAAIGLHPLIFAFSVAARGVRRRAAFRRPQRLLHRSSHTAGSLLNLVITSIIDSQRQGLFGTYRAAQFLAYFLVPAAAVFLATYTVLEWRRGNTQRILLPLTTIVSAAGMIAAHYLVGLKYPIDRTGLAMILLFGPSWALAAGHTRYRWVRAASLLAIQFATQFEVNYFQVCWYDRSSKEIVHRLAPPRIAHGVVFRSIRRRSFAQVIYTE